MRLRCWGSSFSISPAAVADNSTRQGMLFQKVFEWDGLFLALLNAVEGFLGEIEILEIVEVFEDGFADVEGLGAAGAAGELFEPFFDGLGKPDG